MPSNREVEIKFKIENIKILTARLKAKGFVWSRAAPMR